MSSTLFASVKNSVKIGQDVCNSKGRDNQRGGGDGQSVEWFFDTISHEWLVKFLEHRIGDQRVIRLIQKWLTAGVLEQGVPLDAIEGTPQGAVISPFLANVYLHYVYDVWVNAWRKRHATGHMIVVRYADDTVVGFQHRQEALMFWVIADYCG